MQKQLRLAQSTMRRIIDARGEDDITAMFESAEQWEQYKKGDTGWYCATNMVATEVTVDFFQRSRRDGCDPGAGVRDDDFHAYQALLAGMPLHE